MGPSIRMMQCTYLEVKCSKVAEAENEDRGPVEENGVGERIVGIDVHHAVVEHLRHATGNSISRQRTTRDSDFR